MTGIASENKRRRADALDQMVEKIILQSSGPVGAYAISRVAGEHRSQLAPAQVYRSIARLIKAGRITHLVSCNAYIAGHNDTVIHLICSSCNSHKPTIAHKAVAKIHALCDSVAFEYSQLHVELNGQCADCRAKAWALDKQ